MKKQLKAILVVLTVAMLMAVTAFLPANINAGNLEPTGPPGPTMRTLDEIYSAATWSKKITNSAERFELVLDGEAVLDKETGLVWERSPRSDTMPSWYPASYDCYGREVGGRKGWRLPTIEELASLVDITNANPALPTGHPFNNVQSDGYWSSTSLTDGPGAWGVGFLSGSVSNGDKSLDRNYIWCVRGSYGHDAN